MSGFCPRPCKKISQSSEVCCAHIQSESEKKKSILKADYKGETYTLWEEGNRTHVRPPKGSPCTTQSSRNDATMQCSFEPSIYVTVSTKSTKRGDKTKIKGKLKKKASIKVQRGGSDL